MPIIITLAIAILFSIFVYGVWKWYTRKSVIQDVDLVVDEVKTKEKAASRIPKDLKTKSKKADQKLNDLKT